MPIDNLEARLARLDENFKEASVDGAYDNPLPDPGTYQCLLREVDFFEAKKDGTAYLKIVFEITLSTDPQFKGWPIEKIYPLEPGSLDLETFQRKLGFLKKDLKTLGIPVDSDEFTFVQVRPGSPIWDDVLDVPVEIAVVESKKLNEQTGKPYVNTYLNARLGAAIRGDVPATLEPAPAAATADDKIPFRAETIVAHEERRSHNFNEFA